ncbi:MAG: TonB-dependent receptor, partial [Gemmatimonadota bacterium]
MPGARWALPAAKSVVAACVLVGFLGARAQQTLPPVEVVGTTPLAGSDQPLREVAGNARTYSSRDLGEGAGIAGFLGDRAASFTVEDPQGNRAAAEISYRGFTASPLLGAAQGLSVFVDGVRVNEAFGDIVNWDLIPRNAVASVSVMPGSNAVFGLNTLGGALALATKSGTTHPGTEIDAGLGSWGRRSMDIAHGSAGRSVDGFFAASIQDERGWREHSATRLRQFFGELGWRDERTRLRLTVNAADNSLNGTQALPLSFLDTPRAAYTWPDWTTNRLAAVTITAARTIGVEQSLSASVFARRLRTDGLNSNVNDACTDTDCSGNALNDAFSSDERRTGVGVQWLWRNRVAGLSNRTLAGATFEAGRVHFVGTEQPAQFDTTRGTEPVGDFAVTVAARTEHRYRTVFVTDTLSLTDALHVTLSGTHLATRVSVRDASGDAPDLNGDHRFGRFNRALGAAWSPDAAVTGFASFSEGLRAPTAIELTCA